MSFDQSDPIAQLTGGNGYILGIYCLENQDDVYLAVDKKTYFIDQVNFIFYPDVQTWYYLNSESKIQPIIRMNFGNELLGIKENETTKSISLDQNIPNPFSANTTIHYNLNEASENVVMNIYNMLGEKVDSYNEGSKPVGNYSLQLNADNLSSGVYHYTLTSGQNIITKKMSISK